MSSAHPLLSSLSSSRSSFSSSCTCDSSNYSVDEDGHDDESCSSVKQIGRVHCLSICDECIV